MDLSENSINKPALEHIVQAIIKLPSSGTQSTSQRGGNTAAEDVKGASERVASASQTLAPDSTEPQAAKKDVASADSAGPSRSSSLQDTTLNGNGDHAKASGSGETLGEELDYDEDGEPLMPTAPLLRNVSETDENPPSSVISLRLENCGLKTAALEILAQGVRRSDLRHLSLRRNRINQLGTVALAIMLKDYPDSPSNDAVVQTYNPRVPSTPTPYMARTPTQHRSVSGSGLPASAPAGRASFDDARRPYSTGLSELPVVFSSPGGGVTSRRMPATDQPGSPLAMRGGELSRAVSAQGVALASPLLEIDRALTEAERQDATANAPPSQTEEEAIAIYQAKRAQRILADLPRIGSLLTLDLKSNDIRVSISSLLSA